MREDFPILKSVHYLDNAATTQKPKQVVAAIREYYEEFASNVHRSIYDLSERATEKYEGSRDRVASFFSTSSKQIIFTRGATDSLNIVARMLESKLTKDDSILVSELEHHSNLVPWQELAKRTGAQLKFVNFDASSCISKEDVEKSIDSSTKIVALTHCSNVLGSINDINGISQVVKKNNAFFVVDGAQSAAHFKIDLENLGADFFVCSSHKMLGPTGVGVLWGKLSLLESLDPVSFGGDMIREVNLSSSSWNDLPLKFEPGTPNVAGVIGFGAAIDYLEKFGFDKISKVEEELVTYLDSELSKLGAIIHGPSEKIGISSFSLDHVHPHDVASILNDSKVCIRAGHHCAMPLMQKLNVPATCRVSLYFYNTKEDIDALISGLKKAMEVFL